MVYVESESKKVGNLRVPEALMDAMRASPCIDLRLCDEERVALLLEDYDFFVKDPESFCERLLALNELRSKATVSAWIAQVRSGQVPDVVLDLLRQHYDPTYSQSIARNFSQFSQALPCELRDRSPEALVDAAQALIGSETPGSPTRLRRAPGDASGNSVRAALASGGRIPGHIGRSSVITLGRVAVIGPASASSFGLELLLFFLLLGKLALAFFVSVVGSSQIDLSGLW